MEPGTAIARCEHRGIADKREGIGLREGGDLVPKVTFENEIPWVRMMETFFRIEAENEGLEIVPNTCTVRLKDGRVFTNRTSETGKQATCEKTHVECEAG